MISTQLECDEPPKNLTLKETGVYLAERKLRYGEYCIEPLDFSDITDKVQVIIIIYLYHLCLSCQSVCLSR